MKIAVFSKQPNAATVWFIGKVMETMRRHQVEVYLYADLLPLFDTSHAELVSGQFSNKGDLLRCQIDYLFSFGGDGTFLGAAGIVADSNPDKEYDETINKSKAVFEAVKFAETI